MPTDDGQTDFQEKLRTTVRACWNLSAMTGGAGHDTTYAEDHGLRKSHKTDTHDRICASKIKKSHNEIVRSSFCEKENVWNGISMERERMAKRGVATLAGIRTATASDADHSRNSHYYCIYDERDLDQIELPEGLNELQLLWLSMGQVDWLSLNNAGKVRKTADALREHGFEHPLGTLSEETLQNTSKTGEILKQRGLETWVDSKMVLDKTLKITRTRPVQQ